MQRTEERSAEFTQKLTAPKSLIVIGAGAGGPAALANVIPKLPRSLPASIIIIQQMRPGFTRLLAQHLSAFAGAPVEEADNHQPLRSGYAFMAPGGHGLTVAKTPSPEHPFVVELENQSDSVVKMRARVDNAMKSAAELFSSRAIGVLLTGAGADGRDGMKAIRDRGGTTIVQDVDSCVLFDMPKAAIDAGVADETLPLWNIADRLIDLVGDN